MATAPNPTQPEIIHHIPLKRPPKPVPAAAPIAPTTEDEALAIMRRPFSANQISKMCKPTRKDNQPGRCRDCGGWHKLPSVQLSYVGHAALTDRLLDADPKWTWEPLALAPDGSPMLDQDGGMWIKLTVAGVTRLGYGDAQGKSGGDATKERIGDALRNAAMRFGAALELWHRGDLHVAELKGDPESGEDQEVHAPEARQERPAVAPAAPPITPQYPPRKPNAEASRESLPVGSILPFQKNAFLSAAKKSGKTSPQVTEFLHNAFGYDSLDEMPKKDFTQALKWAMEG